MIRWLALLLVLLVLPAPSAAASPAHASQASGQTAIWGFDAPATDRSVVAADDDDDRDDDDSVPPAPERTDDDLLAAGGAFATRPGDVLIAALLFHDTGLRPARGHGRVLELPPRSA